MQIKLSWQLLAVGSAFFAALTAIFGKLGVESINSNYATLIRTLFITGILAILVLMRHDWQSPATISARTWIFLFCSALATGLSWLCYFKALQMGPVSRVAPVDKLSVVFVIIFGIVFFQETITLGTVLGGFCIFLGSLFMLFL
jgi:transporter family protein